MKRKGFTLIELLAVIVILAIIAVIATPIITNIIEDSKRSSFERSVEGIVKGLDLDVSLKLDDSGYTYIIDDGQIEGLDENSNISISNTFGYSGTIKYDKDAFVIYAIHNDEYCMIKSSTTIKTIDYKGNNCNLVYENGDVIYYDVLNGTTCNNYHEDNSKTGYNGVITTTDNQTSCLKFYSFNDEEGSTVVNLLLDHNTTANAQWANSSTNSNSSGPINVIEQLKTDTNSWVGTITPDNFIVSQTTGGNYEIDYSTYKARLITPLEIAEITNNTNFNGSTNATDNWFYFDTNTKSQSSTCKSGNISGCSYSWLYDRTNTSCTANYGCSNNSDVAINGYWTSMSTFGSSTDAWIVFYVGDMGYTNVQRSDLGVRPVIEVLKDNL